MSSSQPAAGSPTASIAPSALFQSLQASRRLNKGLEQARYAYLTTISEEGWPACRTVVVRDVYDEHAIVITTDTRSDKVKQLNAMKTTAASLGLASPVTAHDPSLAHSPLTELCWWFAMTKEQYRFLAHTQLVTATHHSAALLTLRSHTWKNMSPPSRSQFEQPAPGSRKERPKQGDLDRYEPQHPSVDVVSDNFALLLLYPLRCDYVYLPKPVVSPHPVALEVEAGVEEGTRDEKSQARWQLQWSGTDDSWQSVEVNP